MDHSEKLKLYGFNNLTKALSFNIYDVCYAKTPREQKDYIAYIDQQYNSERLTRILTSLTDMIGARVLSISQQDYDPQGASVTLLIAEGSMVPVQGETQKAPAVFQLDVFCDKLLHQEAVFVKSAQSF